MTNLSHQAESRPVPDIDRKALVDALTTGVLHRFAPTVKPATSTTPGTATKWSSLSWTCCASCTATNPCGTRAASQRHDYCVHCQASLPGQADAERAGQRPGTDGGADKSRHRTPPPTREARSCFVACTER
jgi:hypothetical protein